MHDCYKSVVNEMVVNACDVPVVRQACLVRRYLVGVVGDGVQLSKALVVDTRRRPDLRAVRDIAVTIDSRDGFAVRRVAEQLHRIGDDSFIWIGVSCASSRGNRLTKLSEARLPMVLDDLVHAIHHEAVREVPLVWLAGSFSRGNCRLACGVAST